MDFQNDRRALARLFRSPLALAQSKSVRLSFIGLWPGKLFSCFVMYVLFGIFFQNSPVSSQLKTCWGRKASVETKFLNSVTYFSAAAVSELATSPCLATLCIPVLFLKFSDHPQLALNASSSSDVVPGVFL